MAFSLRLICQVRRTRVCRYAAGIFISPTSLQVSKVLRSSSYPDEDLRCLALMTLNRLAFCSLAQCAAADSEPRWTPFGDLFSSRDMADKELECRVKCAKVQEDFVYLERRGVFSSVTPCEFELYSFRYSDPRLSTHRVVRPSRSAGLFTSQPQTLGSCRSVGIYTSRMMSTTSSPLLMLPPIFGEGGKVVLNFHSLRYKEAITKRSEKSDNDKWDEAITKRSEKLALPDNDWDEAITKRSEKLALREWDEVCLVGSSHGWLFAHNRAKRYVFMLNPVTGSHLKLPSLHAEGSVSRVALDEDGCRAMIIFEGRLAFCVPGCSTEWTPIGSGETEYADVVYSSTHKRFFCIPRTYLMELKDPCYGSYSELEVWDLTLSKPRIDRRVGYERYVRPPDHKVGLRARLYDWDMKNACWFIRYLLVHGDDLYVVVRYMNPRARSDNGCAEAIYISKYRGWELSHPYTTFNFDVYKIDWRGSGRPIYMKDSLDGLAMFVGTNESLALVASEHPELNPDSIYFTDEHRFVRKSRAFADTGFGGHDNGIFHYPNYTFSSCCGSCPLKPVYYNYTRIRKIEPPPLWVTLNTE